MTQTQLLVTTPRAAEASADAPRYSLLLVRDSDEVTAAQRLRYQVFAEEQGATVTGPPGLDADRFDEYCDHLVVRDDRTGQVVGCYRMLPPDRARAAGRLYADGEFDLTAIDPLRDRLVETGRSCVHPDHRTGAVMSLMWTGICRYLLLSGHRHLAGCASVSLAGGGQFARGVWDLVRAKHLSPPEYRVRPWRPWDHTSAEPPQRATLPPLLRGYLRLGSWVCGEPAHDPDFGVADLFVLLSLDRVDQRYLRFFLGSGG